MTAHLLRFAVGLVLAHAAVVSAAVSPDVARARQQFRDFYLGAHDGFEMRDTNEASPDRSRAQRFAQAVRPDGTWADIDYAGAARSGWEPAQHYTRLLAIVAAAERPATPAEVRQKLLGPAHRAFTYWIQHDFQCPNWWYNQIGTPKIIGTIALLLGDDLTSEEYRYATGTSLSRYPIAMTGQNKVWLAGNTLMLGFLTGDEPVIRRAADVIWSEVQVTTGEGIQPDFSFHQHGAQQQFGNYGMAFAVETARWGRILRGTPWRLPDAKLAVFSHYLLDGQSWVSWRGAMDISACGRQFMPHSPRDKTANLAQVMQQAESFDPANADKYLAFVKRNAPGAPNDLVGDRYFWRSDYLVHRRPEFAATLKLSSNRVIGAELVNSENLSGYHIADGALYLYRDGGEYEDIFPVWDWSRLPGVTGALVPPPAFKTSRDPRDFVGGVSDGTDGVAAMDYARDGVSAKKAWFFTGDTIVCLGSDIAAKGSATIATTLNQCRLRGAVRVEADPPARVTDGGQRILEGLGAIEHDGWRYALIEPGRLHIDTGPVTGNWHRVFSNPDTPKPDVTKDVFTLWLDHGRAVAGGRYAYVITPVGVRAEARVLENSPSRQVVQLSSAKVGIVFWAAGEVTLPDGRRIGVDAPCLVLSGDDATRVVDPTQKRPTLRLALDGVVHAVALPAGALAGTAAVVKRVPVGIGQ